jgi:protein involved in polysaccharide export with SLBB domain
LALLVLVATGCRSFDDARVVQSLNQRGFGRRYIGNANEIVTIGIGDSVRIKDPFNADILGQGTVRSDGVIALDLVGEVFVAGFSTDEIAEALNQRFAEYYKTPRIQVFIENMVSKQYFVTGELGGTAKREFRGDTTVWDAIMVGQVPITADLADIEVIRPDPVYPLVIPVDLEKMLYYGDSRDNILLREDDIVVVNPNLAGIIKNAVELILQPIQPVLQLAISVRNIETIYDSFVDDENFFVGGSGFNSGLTGYGGTGGTFNSSFSTTPATGGGNP